MDKKKVCKLPPGTFVEILWADSKPTVGMLLEKPQRSNGDISLTVFHVDSKAVDSHAVHSQVSRVLGSVAFPAPVSDENVRFTKA